MTSIPRGASRIQIGASRLSKSNANTFVRARAHGLFLSRVSGLTSGTPLRACGILGVSPRLIPPHSVEYPQTSLASLKYIVTMLHTSVGYTCVYNKNATFFCAPPSAMTRTLLKRGLILHSGERRSNLIHSQCVLSAQSPTKQQRRGCGALSRPLF